MRIARRLKEVDQVLDSIATQMDLAEFLSDLENVQTLDGLVGDIRDAVMEYQVCALKPLALVVSNSAPDLVAARSL
jgi:hypothetical protein